MRFIVLHRNFRYLRGYFSIFLSPSSSIPPFPREHFSFVERKTFKREYIGLPERNFDPPRAASIKQLRRWNFSSFAVERVSRKHREKEIEKERKRESKISAELRLTAVDFGLELIYRHRRWSQNGPRGLPLWGEIPRPTANGMRLVQPGRLLLPLPPPVTAKVDEIYKNQDVR